MKGFHPLLTDKDL